MIFWALFKSEMYSEGKQYTSLSSVQEDVVVAAQKVDSDQSGSVNGRFVTVIEKKGGNQWNIFVFHLVVQ